MTNLNITIEDIKTIKLAKNEHLVFKLNGEEMSVEKLREFRNAVKKALPKLKDRMVFLSGDVEITKIEVQ